ncbi:MAG TPA: ADP-ribosylglycohydrolase family protein [Acidimicrobiia bacterium]|nr:ADP-ribosylglycohydrolase family protein [Acidimicrobiia bacterium]
MPELEEQPAEETSEALFTVVAGEGDGFMLGLAAGDTAGGAWELGYSATTEQATIIAYELIESRSVDSNRLVTALLEMDGGHDEEPVFRAESPEFRMWLDRARAGRPVPGEEPSIDGAVRASVIGVAHRNDARKVIAGAIELGRLFHADASSVAAGVIAASAVAASCFAQSGLDLIAGVAESVDQALPELSHGLANTGRLDNLVNEVTALIPSVGVTSGEEALAVAGGARDDPVTMMLAGVLLAAPVAQRHHVPIEHAARLGGSPLGAAVGAIVGARVGIRAWPWAFANDTWFAEIGRRVVRGPDEVRDLPIPYAVEQHLMSGGRPGFH